MPTIDTVRPDTQVGSTDWTPSTSTLVSVTSDDNDATYAASPTPATDATARRLVFEMDSHTPSAGHARHRVRARIRGQAPNAGSYSFFCSQVAGTTIAVAPPVGSVKEFIGPWSSAFLNVPAEGAHVFLFFIDARASSGASAAMRLNEAYIDIDTRAQPSFTPDVLDAAGVSRDAGTIADTNRATFTFDDLDYDGLVARSWIVTVTEDVTGATVFTASGTGTPPETLLSDPLPDGNYTATLQVFSTIQTDTPFASDVEQLTFEIDFTPPPGPVLVDVTPMGCDSEAPHMQICWEEGSATGVTFDDEPLLELQRVDCNGVHTIFLAEGREGCWCDRFTPFVKPDGCLPGQVLSVPGGTFGPSGASTPDLGITGDISIRAKIIPTYIGAAPITFQLPAHTIASQWDTAGNRGWRFQIREGFLIWVWSDDGTDATGIFQQIDADPSEILYVGVDHDVNDGGGSRVTRFYTSQDGVNWEQLGNDQVFGTAGTIFNSTADVLVGADAESPNFNLIGGVYWVDIYSGLLAAGAGTLVADPDFTEWSPQDTSKADGQAKIWTLLGDAVIGPPSCAPYWQARYWGLVNGAVISTAWNVSFPVMVDNTDPESDWLRGVQGGDLAVCVTRDYTRSRPFGVFQPIGGGIPTVVTGSPGGRDYTLTFPVHSESDLAVVEHILSQQLVLYQPIDQPDVWLAPSSERVQVIKIKHLREISVGFVAVEPPPAGDPDSMLS